MISMENQETLTSEKTDLEQFHKIGKSGNPYDIIDSKIADYVISHNHIIIISGKPYIYKNGVYVKDKNGNVLRYLIKQLIFEELINITRVNRVLNLILADYKLEKDIDDINQYPDSWINFKNGMLDLETMELRDHDPKYLSINQIPHNYVKTSEKWADRSTLYKFINDLIPDKEDRTMFLEYCGYCMTRSTRIQKFMVLNGPGGTGKSTLIGVLEKAVGRENISNLSLQDLNERFAPTNLFGKMLNSCADIPNKAMEKVDVIKKITGEDTIKGEYKGGDVFFFHSYAKLIFSANEIPISLDDKTNAYYRRFLILNIDKRAEYIPDLKYKLGQETEFLISMAVNAAHELFKRGEILESENSKKAVEELYKQADSVQAFIIDEMEKDNGSKITRSELYGLYERYCEENDRTSITKNRFYKNLREKGYKEAKINGIMYFKGLKQVNDGFQECRNRVFNE